MVRGIRGATTVAANTAEQIADATRELLHEIITRNQLDVRDIAAATFSLTTDLNAAFPASEARALGWTRVPMLCHHEVNVPNSLSRCIRVLALWNTDKAQDEVQHVYLREAKQLRPDLVASRQ